MPSGDVLMAVVVSGLTLMSVVVPIDILGTISSPSLLRAKSFSNISFQSVVPLSTAEVSLML